VGGAVFVSALTGFGLDTLRLELAALLATLWEDVDVRLPYTEGELIARVPCGSTDASRRPSRASFVDEMWTETRKTSPNLDSRG
jgi:50S ribosomal subunit-associated GTPase HflX